MSASRPVPRPGVLDIEAYVPGKSAAPAGVKLHKLSSNETPLGPSPKAVAAYGALAGKLELYPDGSSTKLREAIAGRYGLDPARIVCGTGSDELLQLSPRPISADGDEGVFTEHGFLVYRIAILAAGGKPVVVPEKNFTADVDAILAAVTPRTKIVFLANPNNPTGTYLPFDEVKRLHAGLPPHVLLVLDAAYAEYVRRNDYASGLELVADQRECRDDAHLLEDLRPRQSAPRLALRPRPYRRCARTASAARSTSTARRSRPAARRSPTRPMSRPRSSTTTNGSPGPRPSWRSSAWR